MEVILYFKIKNIEYQLKVKGSTSVEAIINGVSFLKKLNERAEVEILNAI